MAIAGSLLLPGLFPSCSKPGSLCIRLCGLANVVAPLVAEHRLYAHRLQWLRHMSSVPLWNVGSSWTSVQTYGPCIGRHTLNHQTTREALIHSLLHPTFHLIFSPLIMKAHGILGILLDIFDIAMEQVDPYSNEWTNDAQKDMSFTCFYPVPDFPHPTPHHQLEVSSIQSLTHVQLFVNPWNVACQASLSITNSQSLLKLMSIELVMPSNHLILCHPLLLLPSIFLSIRGLFK